MNACFRLLTAALLLFASSDVYAAPPADSIITVAQSAPPVDLKGPSDSLQALKQEIESLKATITTQAREIAEQKGAIDLVTRRQDGSNTAIIAAVGVIVAGLVAGVVALLNQNKQAAQERLLKAIEIIMSSRSGYQAEIRRNNLAVFLDEPTKKHLETIGTNFSGPEHTDLLVGLAEAMAEKAKDPEEVLRIWSTVLASKNVSKNITYP
jgi:hypothetical protein